MTDPCPICLETQIIDPVIPDCCFHIHCLKCLTDWISIQASKYTSLKKCNKIEIQCSLCKLPMASVLSHIKMIPMFSFARNLIKIHNHSKQNINALDRLAQQLWSELFGPGKVLKFFRMKERSLLSTQFITELKSEIEKRRMALVDYGLNNLQSLQLDVLAEKLDLFFYKYSGLQELVIRNKVKLQFNITRAAIKLDLFPKIYSSPTINDFSQSDRKSNYVTSIQRKEAFPVDKNELLKLQELKELKMTESVPFQRLTDFTCKLNENSSLFKWMYRDLSSVCEENEVYVAFNCCLPYLQRMHNYWRKKVVQKSSLSKSFLSDSNILDTPLLLKDLEKAIMDKSVREIFVDRLNQLFNLSFLRAEELTLMRKTYEMAENKRRKVIDFNEPLTTMQMEEVDSFLCFDMLVD